MSVHYTEHRDRAGSLTSDAALAEVHAGLVKLHAKVDGFFAAVTERHRRRMTCGPGCSSCCKRMPVLFPVESWLVADHLRSHPGRDADELLAALRPLAQQDEVTPCPMLDRRGHCRIYEARPIICRSHGAPIKVPGRPQQRFDVCPLNFRDASSRRFVEEVDVLDIERLNEILSVIDGLFRQAEPTFENLPSRLPLAAGVLHFHKLF